MDNLLVITIAYLPLVLPSLINLIFYRVTIYDPINLLAIYIILTIMHFINTNAFVMLNYDYMFLVFIGNLLLFTFYFLSFKTNLFKIKIKNIRKFTNVFLIKFNNLEKIFLPSAFVYLSLVIIAIISNQFDILATRRILSQNQLYNLFHIPCVTFAPLIFSKCITQKNKNYLKILFIILTPIATIFVGSSSGIITFSLTTFYFIFIFQNKNLPIFSFKKIFQLLYGVINKYSIKKEFIRNLNLIFLSSTLFILIYFYLRILREPRYNIWSYILGTNILDILTARFDSIYNSLNLMTLKGWDYCPPEIINSRPFHLLSFFIPRSLYPSKPLPLNAIFTVDLYKTAFKNGLPTSTVDFGIHIGGLCDLPPLIYPFIFIFLGIIFGLISKLCFFISDNFLSLQERSTLMILVLNLGSIPVALVLTQLSRNVAEFFLSILVLFTILYFQKLKFKF